MESSSRTAIRMNTNGGMRKPDFWTKMGELFSKRNKESGFNYWQITFSIDGLEDTNHIYRRNVNWKNLMANVTAFIDAGGLANWDYLIFKHNEHQITEAKELATKMKFHEFIPKKALGVDNGTDLSPMPVLTKEGTLDYIIEAPNDPKNRNLENPQGCLSDKIIYYPFNPEDYRRAKAEKQTAQHFQAEVIKVYENRINNEDNSKYDSCSIKCKSRTPSGGKEIFVDNFGRVMPCCYIGTHLNGVYTDTRTLQLHKHMNDYGWDHFSLEKHTLAEILDGEHLDRVFADSWTKESVAKGKLSYCADTCGQVSSIDKIFSHELNDGNSTFKKV
jgi:MoaA/NifB/PqqE/SkfB family radical SAM enzyme